MIWYTFQMTHYSDCYLWTGLGRRTGNWRSLWRLFWWLDLEGAVELEGEKIEKWLFSAFIISRWVIVSVPLKYEKNKFDFSLRCRGTQESYFSSNNEKKLWCVQPSLFLSLSSSWGCKATAAVAAKSLQSCPNLCNPIDGSPPGSPVPGILQARALEWVAISFSNAWKWKVKVNSLSHVRPSATPWTAAYQAPLSMGFSRQEYWSGVP